jgi:hypothetical protein
LTVAFDWVTQVLVPLGAAVVGAGAVLLATMQQIKSSATSVDRQFVAERDRRAHDRWMAELEVVAAALTEAQLNIKMAEAVPPEPMTIEFMLLSSRILFESKTGLLVSAVLAAKRYNSALANRSVNSELLAGEAKSAMTEAVEALQTQRNALQFFVRKLNGPERAE